VFTTGLPRLDETLGGLARLNVVGGDKGVGKSCLAIGCAHANLHADPLTGVLFYSLDLPKQRVYDRVLCYQASLDYRTLKRQELTPDESRSLADAKQVLRTHILPRLKVIQRDFSVAVHGSVDEPLVLRTGLTPGRVQQDASHLLEVTRTRRLLVIVDLFQKMLTPGNVTPSEHDQYRLDLLDEVSRHLQSLLGEGNCAFLVLSEIRKAESGHRTRRELTYDDLKGDGRIASDADSVLLMWPTAPQRWQARVPDVIPVTLRIDKCRDGGERCDVPLEFHHRVCRFADPNASTDTGNRAASASSAKADRPSNRPADPLAE
jgi:replicative DNA helicase